MAFGKPNIKQICTKTGFSAATVSNALNRKRGVNAETAEKIWEVASQLGYIQSSVISRIRFLTIRRSGSILDNSQFFPQLIQGVEHQAKSDGYDTVISNLRMDASNYKTQLENALSEPGTGAVVLATELLEGDYKIFSQAKNPIVFLDGSSDSIKCDSVLLNYEAAAVEAVRYLYAKGHRKIGYLKSTLRTKANMARKAGLRHAVHKFGMETCPEYMISLNPVMEIASQEMLFYLRENQKLPTAFIADDDFIAMGAIHAMKEKGIRVPEQISVIGFGNLSYGEICNPGLTTFRSFQTELGEMAVRRLLDHVRYGSKVASKILIYAEFVERESVYNLFKNEW